MNKILKYFFIVTIIISTITCLSKINSSKKNVNSSNIVEKIDYTTLTYNALGDSITYGTDIKTWGQLENPYPQLVKEKLDLKEVNNYGISGSSLANGSYSYAPMCHRYINMKDADIISVMGGINDFTKGNELGTINDTIDSTFYGALKVLASGLKEKYSNSFIFFMTPYKTSYMEVNSLGYKLEDYVKAIVDVCQLYNIPILDMYNKGQFENEMNEWYSDGIHPQQDFMKDYTAPQISSFIKKNYSK